MGQGTEAGTQPSPLSTLPAARLRSGPVKAVPKLWPASVQSKHSQAGQFQGRGWGLEGKTRERVCCDKTGREARVRLLWAWVMGHGDLADSAGAANCPGHSSSDRLASCLKPAHHLGRLPGRLVALPQSICQGGTEQPVLAGSWGPRGSDPRLPAQLSTEPGRVLPGAAQSHSGHAAPGQTLHSLQPGILDRMCSFLKENGNRTGNRMGSRMGSRTGNSLGLPGRGAGVLGRQSSSPKPANRNQS